MLQRLITAFRAFLAGRTIAAIAGEFEKKIEQLVTAEDSLFAHVGVGDELVNLARRALFELEEKTKAEAAVLLAQIEKSKKLRAKLSA